jgi:hypothetical protein
MRILVFLAALALGCLGLGCARSKSLSREDHDRLMQQQANENFEERLAN